MTIQSHKGSYQVNFGEDAIAALDSSVDAETHYIIDRKVAEIYQAELANVLSAPSILVLDATEENKSLDQMPRYISHLVSHGVRRDHSLVAIGGGIIQDTTCFIAATLMRGVSWKLYPTTLLAQADSCIGSKSSINAGSAKNIVGTFTPPNAVHLSTKFLQTLEDVDVRSGVGEILKVHAIAGPDAFQDIANDYDRLFDGSEILIHYIRQALEIKKRYIEIDEFDRGPRNIFNYGHSFGHAIETATNYAIPHGLGVTMGTDMANFVASELGFGVPDTYETRHAVLKSNYRGFEDLEVPLGSFLAALAKDKKNSGAGHVTLILPDEEAQLKKHTCANDDRLSKICAAYFETGRA